MKGFFAAVAIVIATLVVFAVGFCVGRECAIHEAVPSILSSGDFVIEFGNEAHLYN